MMVSNLVRLFSLIEDEIVFNFKEMISYIEEFPLKYIKIIPINAEKHNILDIEPSIKNSIFKFEYCFPFIKFVISRLIYEEGNHGCLTYINPSNGLGIFLEIQIRKAIIIHKILGEIEYRSFWCFDELNISDIKDYNDRIDIFNLKELNFDDINKNNNALNGKNYYICAEKPNNKYLDSILLIRDNNEQNTFILIAFQIKIKKNKMYPLKEYHEATSFASSKINGVYGININNKIKNKS